MIVRNTQTGKVTRSQTLPDFPFSVLHNGAWMTPTRIGVINGEKGEEDFLASLGIHVRYVPPKGDEYFVILDDTAHAKLDPHWMTRFIWSLETIGGTHANLSTSP